eukprot:5476814-Amphidinium_carterae.1
MGQTWSSYPGCEPRRNFSTCGHPRPSWHIGQLSRRPRRRFRPSVGQVGKCPPALRLKRCWGVPSPAELTKGGWAG